MTSISWWLYTIPFISAFIHWLTIWMALKLLFHPRHPRRILGLFTLHGVFPKRQKQIAESLGRIVGQELLSFDDIEKTITNPQNVQRILPLAEEHIDHFLRTKLKETMPMISLFIGDKTIVQLKTVFMQELEQLFPVIMKNYVANLRNDLDLERIVVDKIVNFSSDRLEQMLNQILTKEFRFVEVIGAALGFFIGLLQIFLSLLMR
ncbi:MAG: DUF445 family protein [Bacteroidota bacterium]|nr:DUF445 family protein [Bacteroidota bacterium]MDP4216959.1 DUF445 family protein [Bacteroidota bacterium]MDP4247818.1 DUF445 family protein [Bacteroidota bacterium]MDP4255845.1 DUF445 family protein [Bacteroidota bacterium]MDP4259714.1 DUF445 family protein [Bacteroidota bacterium]